MNRTGPTGCKGLLLEILFAVLLTNKKLKQINEFLELVGKTKDFTDVEFGKLT